MPLLQLLSLNQGIPVEAHYNSVETRTAPPALDADSAGNFVAGFRRKDFDVDFGSEDPD